MRQAFKFKLMPSSRLKYLGRTVDMAGVMYNHAISLYRRYYRRFKGHLPLGMIQAHMAKLKRTKYPEWGMVNSQSAQAVCERIESGYQLFFTAKGSGRTVRPPGFRKVKKFRSITLKTSGWKILGFGKLMIQKRVYRFRQSRPILGQVKTVTLSRNSLGEFFVSFSCDGVEAPEVEATTGKAAGFDFGLKTFLVRDDGGKFLAPLPLKAALAEVRRASKKLSRKVRGSKGWYAAKNDLYRCQRRIAAVREDWHWKLARTLVLEHPFLVFEDLSLSGMKALWGRKMGDLGFANFLLKVEWMATKLGREFMKIPRYEPTTQTCSACHERQIMTLAERMFFCHKCGSLEDRDVNAAKNILETGCRLRCERAVRPVLQAVLAISVKSLA